MRPNLNLMKATLTGALGGLLFGFDTVVISGAIDALVRLYHLSPQGKGWTVAIALIGTVVGALGAGQAGQKLGGRETLRITAVLYVVSAIGSALAWNWPAFLLFRFVGGLGIGASSVLGPVYIAELAPAKWRGRLVGAFQFNVVFGILVAYTSNYFIRTLHLGAAEWRWQVGVAALPALGFLVLLFGIPRSPRWSASKGRNDEALAVLKLMGDPEPEAELADIRAALTEEHATAHEPVFRWKYRYPLFLAISIGAFNQLAGINSILYYLNSIFASAGFSQISGDQQAIAIGFTNLICDQLPPRRAGLGADYLYRFLRALSGSGDLGLHRRGLSQRRPLQGAGRGQRQPLVHEYRDSTGISHGGGADRAQRSVHLLRRDDGDPVRGGAVCLSRDQGTDAGGVAAQAGASLGYL